MKARAQSLAVCLLYACSTTACGDGSKLAMADEHEPTGAALQGDPEPYARITQLSAEGSGCRSDSLARPLSGLDPDGTAFLYIYFIDTSLWARPDSPAEQSLECKIVATIESSACLGQGGVELVTTGTASLGEGVRGRLHLSYGFLDAGDDGIREQSIPFTGPRGFFADVNRLSEDSFQSVGEVLENLTECRRVRQFAISARLTLSSSRSEPGGGSLQLRSVAANFKASVPDDEGDGIILLPKLDAGT